MDNKQKRTEFGDIVTKLISGYIDAEKIRNPLGVLEEEIAEEILPISANGNIIRFQKQGKYLPKTFKGYFEESKKKINLKWPAKYKIPDLETKIVNIEGNPIKDRPVIFFHSPTNSSQLVFSYHLNPLCFDFGNLGVSFYHSEERFNSRKGLLETRLDTNGLLFIRLEKGNFTDQIYHYKKGKLVQVKSKNMLLSEAFAPKQNKIITVNNISFSDYLKLY